MLLANPDQKHDFVKIHILHLNLKINLFNVHTCSSQMKDKEVHPWLPAPPPKQGADNQEVSNKNDR